MWKPLVGVIGVSGTALTGLAACSSERAQEGFADGDRSALSSAAAVSSFVVLSREAISAGDRSALLGGSVGSTGYGAPSGGSISVGHDARIALEYAVFAPAVTLRDRARAGDINTNHLVAPHATYGMLSPFTPPPEPPAVPTYSAGGSGIFVGAGQTSAVEAGRYAGVTVHGTLELLGGTYEIAQLQLGHDARLVAQGTSVVRIAGTLRTGDRARLLAAGEALADGLRLVVAKSDAEDMSVRLGHDNRLVGLLLAASGVRAGDRLIARGALAARTVTFGHDTTFTFESGFECSTALDCSAVGICQLATCIDGACETTPAEDGTSCDEAGGTCASGVCIPAPPTLEQVQLLVSENHCLNCHAGATPSAGLNLEDLAYVVGQVSRACPDKRILDPGAPERSYLIDKILGFPQDAGCFAGQRMPRGGFPPVSEEHKDQLAAWIASLGGS